MRSISKLLGLSVMLLAVPALAQTVDGGQGKACVNDTDCGGVCGWVCSFDSSPHVCVPAVTQAQNGDGANQGWCTSNAGCACPGQTCSAPYCTPVAFAGNGATPLCVCDSDCPTAGQHCDTTLEMCAPLATGTCNYDGECGCGCFCLQGACECTGAIPPTCSVSADCGPACEGFSCVGGNCVHDEASCLVKNGGTSGGSTGGNLCTGLTCSNSGDCCAGTDCVGGTCQPVTAGTSGGTSGGGATSGGTSGGASTGGTSGGAAGGTSGGGCGQTGVASCTTATETTACCSQYCGKSPSTTCTCNKATNPATYVCVTVADCCSGTCTNGKCLSAASAGTSGGVGGGTSGGATGGTSGGTTAAADGGNTSGSGGCGCGTGASGTEGFALLALGLAVLFGRKRLTE